MSLQVPPSNEREPRDAGQALATIHQENTTRLRITLLRAQHAGQVGLYVRYPQDLGTVVERKIASQYLNARQEPLREGIFDQQEPLATCAAELVLTPGLFPLRRYSRFENMIERSSSDPLAGLLTAIALSKQDPLNCRIELHVRPATRWRHRRARRVVDRLAWPFFARHWFFSELYATAAMHRWVSPTRLLSPTSLSRWNPNGLVPFGE